MPGQRRWYDKMFYDDLDKETVLGVEQAVRLANAKGWEIGDDITLGVDPAGKWFISDLSNAHQVGNLANEWWRIERFFELAGADWLLSFRKKSRDVLQTIRESMLADGDTMFPRYVYASFNRPISRMWAILPDDAILVDAKADWSKAVPHTFVLTREPILDIARKYELKLGWMSRTRLTKELLQR